MLMRTVWRAQASGTENVPRQGALIVACNHRSYLDPPGMGCFCPRRISYMAKKELFEIPVLGPLIRAVGAYPVDRQGSARAAIKRSLEVLEAGGTVGIFPEGTRNRDGSAAPQTGVALLASLSGAPVVPAHIGSDGPSRLARMKVAFGPPMRLPPDRKATHDDLAKFTADIMQAIQSLGARSAG
ncbi:MAG: 1-acyl-sn-glycerol-3-phosphate acyltransferase [Candidatus Eremiobacteraeota bacterium]|nr:1-acyl-sn-glycerol-3-phosphate acyltransferase [Candidatus Eremiobacteraeota bacterium]MBV8655332.1 1-acyl-sn-glycerol-3-phosphate acyltransferase [Candidatus Eremiobacteraeota bacterium]